MPKPSRSDLHRVISEAMLPDVERLGSAIMVLSELIDEWEVEDGAERERGRKALEILEKYAGHSRSCAGNRGPLSVCDCGLDEALAEVDCASDAPSAASREDVTPTSEKEDVEQWNLTAKVQREAFKAAAHYYDMSQPVDEDDVAYKTWALLVAQEAASRYPLRKRVTKVIPDPHNSGRSWRLAGNTFEWSDPDIVSGLWRQNGQGGVYLGPTPARVLALAELLKDPWTIEETTDVEEVK